MRVNRGWPNGGGGPRNEGLQTFFLIASPVVKIGLTRRLEPDDRVKELGDASVPFGFDTHAMIYSDEAPALESALHKEFPPSTRTVRLALAKISENGAQAWTGLWRK